MDRAPVLGGIGPPGRPDPRQRPAGSYPPAGRVARPPEARLDRRILHRPAAAGCGARLADGPGRPRGRGRGASGSRLGIPGGDRGCLLDRGRVELPDPAQSRPGDVRGRHDLVPHAGLRQVRPGPLDHPAPLHRSAPACGLVLPADLGADAWRPDRPDEDRLALAPVQHVCPRGGPARRLGGRAPLRSRTGHPGGRRPSPQLRRDDRDPARGGEERHPRLRLPARIRRLPGQRPPAKGPGGRTGGRGSTRSRRPPAGPRPTAPGRGGCGPRNLGKGFDAGSGRGDLPRDDPRQRSGPVAYDDSLAGDPDAPGRGLLVRAGDVLHRGQPGAGDRLGPPWVAPARPDAP